jgi:hypothetical protein
LMASNGYLCTKTRFLKNLQCHCIVDILVTQRHTISTVATHQVRVVGRLALAGLQLDRAMPPASKRLDHKERRGA